MVVVSEVDPSVRDWVADLVTVSLRVDDRE